MRAWASVADVLELFARVLLPDGTIVPQRFRTTATSSARAINTFVFQLTEGFLLDLTVTDPLGVPRRGQLFVQVYLGRGVATDFVPVALLVSDYLTASQALAWPGGILRSSLEGPGILRAIAGTNPAAGVEISETVPTNARWRFVSLRATLVAAAVAATRTVSIRVDDGSTPYFSATANIDQIISQTVVYTASALGFAGSTTPLEAVIPMPPALLLLQGHRFRTSTYALDPGDNWGTPQYLVEEWIEE